MGTGLAPSQSAWIRSLCGAGLNRRTVRPNGKESLRSKLQGATPKLARTIQWSDGKSSARYLGASSTPRRAASSRMLRPK